ncbi:hypothetical protein Goshw_010541 [Gossypium schwendimanii]|uniref:Uncharacterized protein n=1 Tax=Gossypium schwendimanii TaxID=34291 RepID=A0A7J9MZH0_GOSSC|nr:hypothetical protein [Gossypium schwendimanii]
MEEEKMNLRLDIDVEKLETEKLRKGKNKAKEELEIREERTKSIYGNRNSKRFRHEMRL